VEIRGQSYLFSLEESSSGTFTCIYKIEKVIRKELYSSSSFHPTWVFNFKIDKLRISYLKYLSKNR
jgi:hypothetical protein